MTQPTYPNFSGKHAHDAMINPADFIAYQRKSGLIVEEHPPAGVILCYQRALYDYILETENLTRPERRGALPAPARLASTGGKIGVLGQFGIGAPAAAAVLEELIALGSSRFISIGTAGSLQPDLLVGDLVVCAAAVRDEGVSHHYLPPGKLVSASAHLTAALKDSLVAKKYAVGVSWTIDAPYRETVSEARHYQSEGVLCVEMEAAALFAVGQAREIEIASALVISDSLAGLVWDPQLHGPEVRAGLIAIYEGAVSALAR